MKTLRLFLFGTARRRSVWFLFLAAACAAYFFYRAPSRSIRPPILPGLTLVETPEGLVCPQAALLPRARVRHTVDGDTLKVLWEGRPETVRYYGINTPERGRPCYDEATERNRALAGVSVRLAFDRRFRDRHGRMLAYVFTEEGLSLDAQLVSEGLARSWKKDGRFRGVLKDLERKARADRRGCLWEEGSGR